MEQTRSEDEHMGSATGSGMDGGLGFAVRQDIPPDHASEHLVVCAGDGTLFAMACTIGFL